MKKLLLLIALFISVSANQSKAQTYVTIPDANFVAWLNNAYPSCMVGDQMDITCPEISSATIVNVQSYNISDLTGIEHFTSCFLLNCGFNQLTFLPTLPPNLINLTAFANQLTELPPLPESLLILDCSSNQQLLNFPEWPSGLQNLSVGDIPFELNNFPELPESLTFLDVQSCQLDLLPPLPPNLLILFSANNPLGILPELPSSLLSLACLNNQLNELPNPLPPMLEELLCSGNYLSSLPPLPDSMTSLQCQENQITTIDYLPNSIHTLLINNNLLTSLPSLPTALTYFECYNNQLTELPALPPLLHNLHCQNNQLTSIGLLPESMLVLNCANNQITCFEPFPSTVASPNITNNPFTCLPNYIPSMGVVGLLDYPLCEDGDLTDNPFGCASAEGVTGKIYNDDDSDCNIGAGESGMVNVPVSLFDDQGNFVSMTSSATNGIYFLSTDTLDYLVSVDVENKPYQASCVDPGSEIEVSFSPALPLIQDANLGMECLSGHDIGVQSAVATGIIFPGQPHTLRVIAGDLSSWYGLACATGVSGNVTISVNGPVTYLNPAPGALTPNGVIGNDFTYNIADFGTLNMQTAFRLVFETDTTAQADDQVCVTVDVTPLVGDISPANNTSQHCYTVVNSYDPNIKTVSPGNVEPGFDGYFNYTIYFQNTGNAPAFNIRLADTLDTNLDLSTFEVTNYSHPVLTYLNGNVLTFRFNNIMLPDSTTDLEGSIGFVQYRIKPLADLPVGTVIENTAHIYFDFNDAIVTNTTLNEFVFTTSVADHQNQYVSVYPNPGTGVFNLKWNNANSANTIIEVYNIRGERVVNTSTNQNLNTLDLSNYPAGMYLVRVNSQGNVMQTKVILR